MKRLEVREDNPAEIRKKRGGAGRSSGARAPGARRGGVVTVHARRVPEGERADGGGGGRMFEKTNVGAGEGRGPGGAGAWNHNTR